jgi:serine/threonine-protein kinase SRPK3
VKLRWRKVEPTLTKYTSTNKYAALKIYAHDLVAEDEIDNETAIYKHLSTAGNPDHPGKLYIRTIQDFFFVTSRAGNPHQCLVHEVLSNDILSLRYAHPDRKLPEAMLRQFLIHLLLALDFLHSECHIIHTGQVAPLTMLWKTLTECQI